MKLKYLILLLTLILITSLHAADSPVSLYEKWRHKDVGELMNMGTRFDYNCSGDSALVCYSVVADRLRAEGGTVKDRRDLARALNNMGFIYGTYFFDYKKALELFQESREVSEACDYKENLPYIYLNIGGVYLSCNMMYDSHQLFADEIWENLSRALSEGISTKQYDVVLVAFLNIGQMHLSAPDAARIKEAATRLRATRFPQDVKLVPYTLAYCEGLEAFSAKDYAGASAAFRKMLRLIPEGDVNGSRLELHALNADVCALKAAGRYDEAVEVAGMMLDRAKAAGAADIETITCRTLAELHNLNNQEDSATRYMLQYHQKKDSTLSARDVTMLSKLPLVRELDGMKDRLEQEQARKRMLTIIGGVVLLSAIFLALYVISLVRSRRKLKQYVKELYRKNVELLNAEKREKELREAGEELRRTEPDNAAEKKYASSSLTPNESQLIADRILKVMLDTDLITRPDFSLKDLAASSGYPLKVVSQVINETLGKNFRTLLGEYRIKEACKRLLDTDNYGQYTMEHIAEGVGFNSRSAFSVLFKKITGITPAQFQKNARSEE